MRTHTIRRAGWYTLVPVLALLGCQQQGPANNDGKPAIPASPGVTNPRQDQRWLARQGQSKQAIGSNLRFAGINQETAQFSALGGAVAPLAAATMSPGGPPDYFGVANWANSPLALVDPSTGAVTGGIKKFVDDLPGFCALNPSAARCLPLANPVKTSTGGDLFPGSDTYYIGLSDYAQRMHSALPPTKLRGYVDLNGTNAHQYLGPVIVAFRDRPVRVKFTNQLGTGAAGNLFIPTDTTYMGAGMGPDGTPFTQNRATLHLHGGNTPWISDGTPHQWTVPAGEKTNHKKGVSARDVPDMPATGEGELTFYWTNQQSGRLMFYHDHAYGVTRLNVYAGEAAGYLLVDPAAEAALKTATVPGTIPSSSLTDADLAHFIPLVIQDKTFVPDDGAVGGQLAATDPTWDVLAWGGAGSFWFPHLYLPNQNPADVTGANAFGRWDYGPWFWPPQDPSTFVPEGRPYACDSAAYATTPPAFPPLLCPGTPKPSGTPEGFMDTPVVNGTAYPSLNISPTAYRFSVLSAGNDRTWNFGLYYAATATGTICKGGAVADLSTCTEVSMVPAVPHFPVCASLADTQCLCGATAATQPAGCFANPVGTVPLCSTESAMGGGGLVTTDLTSTTFDPVTGLPFNLDSAGAKAPCWPTSWPTDGREGGVPDPTTAGPAIVQIASEGGLLPAPAAIPSTPTNFEYNRRSITVLNIFHHGLLLGPAERADVVVDFSGVPSGSALILYNDAPAPVPAFDPRVDYYTNGPDYSPTGGAPSTPPGYGPNTRTVMQFKVTGTAEPTFSFGALKAALPGIFATAQDKIIIPETAYPAANGGAAVDTYARIQDTTLDSMLGGAVAGVTIGNPGSGFTAAPTVTFSGGGGTGTAATATIAGSIAGTTLTNPGQNFTDAPTVTFSAPAGCVGPTCATATGVAVLTATSVGTIRVTNGGSGYIGGPGNAAGPTVFISPPGCDLTGPNCVVATAHSTVSNGRVNAVVIDSAGAGYTMAPTVSFWDGSGTGATAEALLTRTNVAQIEITSGGAGYRVGGTTAPATVTLSGGGGTNARATVNIIPTGSVFSITLTSGGSGYTSLPAVTLTGGGGTGATAFAQRGGQEMIRKTIQELFTLDYGRMNATLGVELPLTNFLTQTTIPYGYVDPPTEIMKNGETQIWKITHNGVDTHFIHFHLFLVQVINRVGWDGAIKPPDANELGWKDTVRMNPLEDIVIAIRPFQQTLPWKLGNSIRPLDVTQPIGSALLNQFTNVDPTNQPAAVVNDLTNFGWEYVWHCHILGHEENDMMRTMSFVVPPDLPALTAKTGGCSNGRCVTLDWTTTAPTTATGFTLQVSVNGGAFADLATFGENVRSYLHNGLNRRTTYQYRITADNTVGYTRQYAAPAAGYPVVTSSSAPATSAAVTIP